MSEDPGSISRRRLLVGLGASGFGVAAGFVSHPRAANAEPLTGPPPEIDRLSVLVLTDSFHHGLEPSGKFGDILIQRYSRPPSKENPKTLMNEWGLALHVETARGPEARQILVDFGFTPEALNHNMSLLGVDPARLDAFLLTHGHFDHFGGMVGFLAANKAKLKPGLPFYLGGEECFCTREMGVVNAPVNFGTLDRKAIAGAGLRVTFADRPFLLLTDQGFTTGPIPLTSFEKATQSSRMKIGLQPDGLGCSPEGLPLEKRTLTVAPDDFQHEQATCFNVKGKGLVVLTSCGHRGIVNSVRAAMKVSGVQKVHAVLGGFHLAPMPVDYVRGTVAALKEINPDYVIPMHCSGSTFYEIARQELPGRVPLSSTGTKFVFGV